MPSLEHADYEHGWANCKQDGYNPASIQHCVANERVVERLACVTLDSESYFSASIRQVGVIEIEVPISHIIGVVIQNRRDMTVPVQEFIEVKVEHDVENPSNCNQLNGDWEDKPALGDYLLMILLKL